MIIVCPGCQARYKFDEAKLGERPRAKTRCAKCGGSIEIENPMLGAMTLPPGAYVPPPPPPPASDQETKRKRILQPEAEVATGRDLHESGALELPKEKRYSLAVIQGEATGQIFQITKTRTTLGRSGSDINLNDPESSRQHAAVEIYGDHALVRDLDSTNGTYVETDKIQQHVLQNHMEFRIGSHVLMFIVTDVE
jgi:predicted Zn finger-like uncharacterized protein